MVGVAEIDALGETVYEDAWVGGFEIYQGIGAVISVQREKYAFPVGHGLRGIGGRAGLDLDATKEPAPGFEVPNKHEKERYADSDVNTILDVGENRCEDSGEKDEGVHGGDFPELNQF